MSKGPAKNPCGSCPYRTDVPSGVWHATEYQKLSTFDGPMSDQPVAVFHCHQNDGRLCAGWVGCHDMEDSLGLRTSLLMGHTSPEVYEECLDYVSPVPLFKSGTEAMMHGIREYDDPNPKARKVMDRLVAKGLVQRE